MKNMADDRLRPHSRTGSVFQLFVSSTIAQGVGLALAPLIARALGPALRGQAALVTVYEDASSALFHCGLPPSVGHNAKRGKYSEADLLGAVIAYGLLAMPISTVVAVAAVHWPLNGIQYGGRVLALLLIALSPLMATSGVTARQLLIVRRDLNGLRNMAFIQAGFRVLVILPAWLTDNLGLVVTIVALCVGGYVANIYAFHRLRVRPHISLLPLRTLLSFGIRALPSSLASLANGRLEMLILAYFLSANAIGIYAVAATAHAIFLQVGAAWGPAAFARTPAQARLASRGLEISRLIRHAWVSVLLLALSVWAALQMGAISLLFGSDFSDAKNVAILLVPGSVSFAMMQIMQQVAMANGRPSIASEGQIVALGALAVSIPLFVHYYGLIGAACASSTAYSFALAWTQLRLRSATGLRYGIPRFHDLLEFGAALRGSIRR